MIGRIPVLDVAPTVNCGRWPVKAVPGELIPVSATVFREGHDRLGCTVVLRGPKGERQPFRPMTPGTPGTDRWHGSMTPTGEGRWTFWVEAWGDPFATWRHDAGIKIPADQDVELMLEEGARLLTRATRAVPKEQRGGLIKAALGLRDAAVDPVERLALALDPAVVDLLARYPLREFVSKSATGVLQVDRPRALFGSWYEFFPRSEGATLDPPRSGTFASAAERLPAIADMGFDVVYLPPIHPIGTAFRKGANNSLTPGPDDPGSPWAIGSPDGGHDAIHPDLGSIADFDAFVTRTRELGMEVALDLALQASPDHPWVTEHPEWFTTRADGSIAYAENPPKKYQDIYPINFDNDYAGIYAEIRRILHYWMDHGVRIFRVDNPHTKPVAFWEELLADIRRSDPDVLFLAEAFTRPAMMHTLGKVGFHQSYTYFTWRNEKHELQEYLTELAHFSADFLRPNFFVNTQDILHAFLQYGGPPAFKIRAALAAMLSPTWGVYSGYELYEHVAVRPGSEEYDNAEKYAYRPRDWAAVERDGASLAPYIRRLNEIRRTHPALHQLRNLRFHGSDDPAIMAFSKAVDVPPDSNGDADVILVVINLDPHAARETTVSLNLPELGVDWGDHLAVTDELTGASYEWGQYNYVRLDSYREPAHIFTVRPGTPR
ncbi:MAG: alpha-1,4-glucan--maltose-1-phosphate maltosyltransferase [Frankiaceae bacterium]